jgi:thioredoxin reductase (NADPH)
MEIMVVGGGDTAMEEATFLTKFCKKVNIVHRRDELRASKIMQDRALENPKIEVLWNSVIEEIYDVEKGEVTGVLLKDTKTGETRRHDCQGVFLAIGHNPITKLFKGQLDLDDTGYIITKPDSTYTSIDGIFACGDVQDHTYRQAITAAGSGCMAAIDCERWLEAQEK